MAAGLLSAGAILAACAPVEIKRVETGGALARPLPAPHRIVVEDFVLPAELVRADRSLVARGTDALDDETPSAQAAAEAERIVEELAKHVVAEVRWLGWPADHAARRPAEAGDLRVSGAFVKASEGDGTERLLIGFGLGRSKLATHVQVLRVGLGEPLLVEAFDVEGAGGRAPGLLTAVPVPPVTPVELADDAVSAGMSIGEQTLDPEVKADVRRVATGIGAQLSALFLRQRWMPTGAAPPAAAGGSPAWPPSPTAP